METYTLQCFLSAIVGGKKYALRGEASTVQEGLNERADGFVLNEAFHFLRTIGHGENIAMLD